MKKTISRLIFIIFLCVISAFALCNGYAVEAGEGYVVNSDGTVSNIKWKMTADATLSFEIDASATGKVSSTVIPNRDPVTGESGDWNKALPTYKGAKKIIIGDGITEVSGFMCLDTLLSIEVPTSLKIAGNQAFQGAYRCKSLYVRGTSPVDGVFDLSNFTEFKKMSFDSCCSIKNIIFNEELAGNIPHEFIKECVGMTELTIPAGVAQLDNGSISKSDALKVITILGKDTVLQSKDVFAKNAKYPAIKAYSDSKAAEFAKANGFTFIDLESGDVTAGTLPTSYAAATQDPEPSGGETPSGESTGTTPSAEPTFDKEKTTAWGYMYGEYQLSPVVDTFWAYYDETKTLEFISNASPGSYNETGNISYCSKEYGDWSIYKESIEHIIVGDNIAKLSEGVCGGMPLLKDVRLGNGVRQMNDAVFTDSPMLTTVWVNGNERIEGRADMMLFKNLSNCFKGTAIKEIVIPSALLEKLLSNPLPISFKTAISDAVSDAAIELAKLNVCNIRNSATGEEYNYYIELPEGLPMCGPRAVFDFDEATGTLTVIGAGIVDDIVNYYGGGSKTQPWFSIKQKIKHVIIDERIVTLGKYAFCQCSNLETVQIPDNEDFSILNGAFEKCTNLKSIYRAGTEPIEGTADLSKLKSLESWSFAYDFLIANIIVSEKVEKIGSSVFSDNVNLANVYGVPGSYAEEFAAENGLAFFDASSNIPTPITCTVPETTTEASESESIAETVKETEAPETEAVTAVQYNLIEDDGTYSESSSSGIIIIAVVAVAVSAGIAVVFVIVKKKK